MMKTSNKILLSFFGLILLTKTIILFGIGKNINGDDALANDEKVGNAEQQRNLPPFNKIDIENKFRVHYTQDTFQNVVVKADSNLVNLAITVVRDGQLFIHSTKRLRSRQYIDVYVTNDSLNEVKSNAGGLFKTLNKMKVFHFNGIGEAGAIFQMDGNYTNLSLNFTAGCVSDLSGNCQNIDIESNTGCVINASNLIVNKGRVSASTGAVSNLNITGELSLALSTGAVVKCQGNPQIKSISISTGAQFIK